VLHRRRAAVVDRVRDHRRRREQLPRVVGDQAEHVPLVDLVRGPVLEHRDLLRRRVDAFDALEVHHDLAEHPQRQVVAHVAARQVRRRVVGVARPEVAHHRAHRAVVQAGQVAVVVLAQTRQRQRPFEGQRDADVRARLVQRRRQARRVVPRLVLQALRAQQHRIDRQRPLPGDHARRQRHEAAGLRRIAGELEHLHRLRVALPDHRARRVAHDEEVLVDPQIRREREPDRPVPRHHRERLAEAAAAEHHRLDLAHLVVERLEQLEELRARHVARDQQLRLQRVGVRRQEVVPDLVVPQVLVRLPLVDDVAADHHVAPVRHDRRPFRGDLQPEDVDQPAVLDPLQFRMQRRRRLGHRRRSARASAARGECRGQRCERGEYGERAGYRVVTRREHANAFLRALGGRRPTELRGQGSWGE
jgi:hypothetical protein